MNALEIIALITALVVLLKLTMLTFWSDKLLKFSDKYIKKIEKYQKVAMAKFLILALIVGYFVFASGLTIVQVMSVVALTTLLVGFTFVSYPKMATNMMKTIPKTNIIRHGCLAMLIYAILALWTLYYLFF